MARNFTVTLEDLNFFLANIKIAERHAAGESLNDIIGPSAALLPYGLRTVDGSYNSLLPGNVMYGAADQILPRLTEPFFRNEGDDSFTPGPGAPPLTNNDYNSTGYVVDADPRIISNLIVDQTNTNPAAVAAWYANPIAMAEYEEAHGGPPTAGYIPSNEELSRILNLSPDIGLSPSFNGWMTLFGQFFDHGLDLISKGGNSTVYIPLQPDDPLYVPGAPNFMPLTRSTQVDGHETTNQTTPFIDQNQTYTSHASHQVFLREYAFSVDSDGDGVNDSHALSTGRLLNGATGGLATWGETKAQALQMLGIRLGDYDVLNVPLLVTDAYGRFVPGANGYAQIILADGSVLEGTAAGVAVPANAAFTGHAFLNDIAHHAEPVLVDHDGNRATAPIRQTADTDNLLTDDNNPLTYDDEMLDSHFIAGDGRGNENIGLTAVHTVFHSEHNRVLEENKATILASGDLDLVNEWLREDIGALPTTQAEIDALVWDGDRLFQAARVSTEMQYQHMVFEEFARKIQPNIDPFVFTGSADIDPAITAEFAHVVYRFGHSMLTDTIDILDPSLNDQSLSLVEAFLNPQAFDAAGTDAEDAAGSIIRGMTRQVGNEIDEFVVDSLRNFLVGLPLDLAALNIARGRETGVAPFNMVRADLYAQTGDPQLKPYTSWLDFAQNIKNPLSIVNFIAAYGTHDTITAATTVADKRAAASLLVLGGTGAPLDRIDFLNSTGTWATREGGLNLVDLWIGGLAEEKMEFGGMLGSTFNFVFENQMENLQNGDRFYYLSRTQGTNLLNELEQNTFADMVMRNTNLGELHSTHLAAHIFDTPDAILELDPVLTAQGIGIDDPEWEDAVQQAIDPKVVRIAPGVDVDLDGFGDGGVLKFSGGEHVVLGGSEGNDRLIGDKGIDTLWGDGGNDYLNAASESDEVFGGDGDDIIEDPFGDDFLRGNAGNDVISSGPGFDVLFGNEGKDFIVAGTDAHEVFAGRDDDFVLGGSGSDTLLGNEGDDWIEGGEGFDGIAGTNSELFFNSPIIDNDILNGQGNDTDYDGESGDDIMFQGAGIQRNNGMSGFDWAIHQGDNVAANSDLGISVFATQQELTLRDRNDLVEALSGWDRDDRLTGRERQTGVVGVGANEPDLLGNPDPRILNNDLYESGVRIIDGLRELLSFKTWDATDPDAIVIDGDNADDLLIGGGGSDILTGKAGNDIIDGDAYLHVYISVRANRDGSGAELFRTESLASLQARMLNGTINPGQLVAMREIVYSTSGLDTVVYAGPRTDFTVTVRPDGRINVVDNIGAEGDDMLRNIERLQFGAGPTLEIVELNRAHTGHFAVSDTTPVFNQTLSVVTGSFSELDGVAAGAVTRQWQQQTNGVWSNIAGATADTLTVGGTLVGHALRVVSSYTDLRGFTEQDISDATGVVTVTGANIVNGTNAANTLAGGSGVDIINGLDGNDDLRGNGANDFLFGGNGNDRLMGNAGTDYLFGGQGNDTYYFVDALDIVDESDGGGVDLVVSTVSYTLGTEIENLQLASPAITGIGNDRANEIRGNDFANVLEGRGGDDLLIGGGGADHLLGGAGNDIYYFIDAGDIVDETGGGGVDLVVNAVSYTLTSGVENLTLAATADRGTGNGEANAIRGNSSANLLEGQGGDDTLIGNGGDDRLIGGLGNDQLIGGAGLNTYVFGPGGGTDTVGGFDANATGGQDKLDISAFGLTAGTFAGAVQIAQFGSTTHVNIGDQTIILTRTQASTIDITDFVF